jgi:predicted MPP superfamily phosphohydrolase
MKLIALGDTHGRVLWKKIVEKYPTDKIVFIGDYFDTHGGTTGQGQLDNFNEIIEFKKANMDRVTLLFGNHDFHYLSAANEHYSGYQPVFHLSFKEVLNKAIDEGLVQMVYVHDKYMFSHAGVTKTWCIEHDIEVVIDSKEVISSPERQINDLFKFKPTSFNFSGYDCYGDDITQSPIWVRPASLYKDRLDQYVHIVGHTTVTHIAPEGAEKTGMILIDALGTSEEYLVFEDDKVSVEKV